MRYLVAIVALALLVSCVGATSLNFQNPTDNQSIRVFNYNSPNGAQFYWTNSTTGLNNYIVTRTTEVNNNYRFTGFALNNAEYSTYAAATLLYSSGNSGTRSTPDVAFFDTNGNILTLFTLPASVNNGLGRWEVKVSGGDAYLYINNVEIEHMAIPGGVNPSYIAFGVYGNSDSGYDGDPSTMYWDDYIYGQTENKYSFGLPESDGDMYIILQDVASDANNGLAWGANGLQINANYMQGQWSRGALGIPASALPNETIQLVNVVTGTVYAENYTGTAYSGIITINIKTALLDTHAPDGNYALTIHNSGKYSNWITKKSNGAAVTWSSDTYSIGQTGAAAYWVLDGGYWDPGAYTYKMAVLDVYGNFKQNTSITMQTGSVPQTWTSGVYNQGVYYAWLIATDSAGREYLLGADATTLSAQFKLYGYIYDEESGNAIPNAVFNCSQGSAWSNGTSDALGHYETTSTLLTGSVTGMNVSNATVHNTYWWNATPIGVLPQIDIVLERISPTFTGLAIGGVDRDTDFHRPIPGANIRVYNDTFGENYIMLTSPVGYYRVDASAATYPGDSCTSLLCTGSGGGAHGGIDGSTPTYSPVTTGILTNGRLYHIVGYKPGYANSTTYQKVVVSI